MSPSPDLDVVHLHKPSWKAHPSPSAALAALESRSLVFRRALEQLCLGAGEIDAAAVAMIDCLRGGGRVLVAGNGGSAAEAQHLATELVGRFLRERAAYAVLSLTADSVVLTAIANDYGFDSVFARQVSALGQPGDVLVCFSTSGQSQNLLNAADVARQRGLTVVALTGIAASCLAERADIAIRVPARETPLVQELHTVVLHVLCDLVERELSASDEGTDQMVAAG